MWSNWGPLWPCRESCGLVKGSFGPARGPCLWSIVGVCGSIWGSCGPKIEYMYITRCICGRQKPMEWYRALWPKEGASVTRKEVLVGHQGIYCFNSGVAVSPLFYLSISHVQKPMHQKIGSNWSMYIVYARYRGGKNSFKPPGWALEAPNHALAPPNEVVHDSEWFWSISHGQKPKQQQKVCSNRSMYTRYIAKTSFGAGDFRGSKSRPSTPKLGLTGFWVDLIDFSWPKT